MVSQTQRAGCSDRARCRRDEYMSRIQTCGKRYGHARWACALELAAQRLTDWIQNDKAAVAEDRNGNDPAHQHQRQLRMLLSDETDHHIRKDDAAWRGCFNAEMAAWFLRQRLDAPNGGDYWARVATYHSATPKYNAIYRSKLIPLSARWGRWLQANYTTSTSYH